MTAIVALLLGLLPPQVSARGDGFEFLKAGKPAYARTVFRNQLKKSPSDPRALAGLGLAELALGNADLACEQLLEAIHKDPDAADARLGLARSFLNRARSRIAMGRADEEETRYFLLDAADQAERAAALLTKDPLPWSVAAEAKLEVGDGEGAERAIAEAERRGLDPAGLRKLRGQLSYYMVRSRAAEGEAADFDAAKAALDALIADDPKSAELRLRLGDLQHDFGHWNEALAAWKSAFELDPFDRPTLEMVLAYLKVPELRAAAHDVLETALASAEKRAGGGDPRPGYVLFCVGQAKLAELDWEPAAALFKKARALDGAIEMQCSLGIAESAFKLHRYDEAGPAWTAAFSSDRAGACALLRHLGSDAGVAAGLRFLADQEYKNKKSAAARDLMELSWTLLPDDPNLCNNYAFLCRETGKYEASWAAYSHLIELTPDQPRNLNDAALILQDYLKKDLVLARSLYERAIAAADALLGDPLTPQVTREMAASAKTDATSNLARMKGGGK